MYLNALYSHYIYEIYQEKAIIIRFDGKTRLYMISEQNVKGLKQKTSYIYSIKYTKYFEDMLVYKLSCH